MTGRPMRAAADLPVLLATAATVLEAVQEKLPPLTVYCDPRPPIGAPVVITPTATADEEKSLQPTIEHLARALGTWPSPLRSTPGWTATGTVAGVAVEAMAAPSLGPTVYRPERRPGDSTAVHAKLLRDLTGWVGNLPEGVRAVRVYESATAEGLRVNLEVDPSTLDAVLAAHAVLTAPAMGIWDKARGFGVTPTGHELVISLI